MALAVDRGERADQEQRLARQAGARHRPLAPLRHPALDQGAELLAHLHRARRLLAGAGVDQRIDDQLARPLPTTACASRSSCSPARARRRRRPPAAPRVRARAQPRRGTGGGRRARSSRRRRLPAAARSPQPARATAPTSAKTRRGRLEVMDCSEAGSGDAASGQRTVVGSTPAREIPGSGTRQCRADRGPLAQAPILVAMDAFDLVQWPAMAVTVWGGMAGRFEPQAQAPARLLDLSSEQRALDRVGACTPAPGRWCSCRSASRR
jgi:hypothetical protein